MVRKIVEIVRQNLHRADETSRRLQQLAQATKTDAPYPATPVGQHLELIARLLAPVRDASTAATAREPGAPHNAAGARAACRVNTMHVVPSFQLRFSA
jgi:hypothetical protein